MEFENRGFDGRLVVPSATTVCIQGFDAGRSGVPRTACPYTLQHGLPAMNTWLSGWEHGNRQRSLIGARESGLVPA